MSATLDDVRALFADVRRGSNGGLMVHCPCHEDKNPSLSFWVDGKGNLAHDCKGGCEWRMVHAELERIGLDFGHSNGNGKLGEMVVAYDYTDEAGEPLYQNCRFVPKGFRARRPDGNGGFVDSVEGVRRVLFHLPRLIAGVKAGRTIYLCEGEKDVLAVEKAGAYATTKAFGAKSEWLPEYSEFLRGVKVVIVAHRDEAGRECAMREAAALRAIAANVSILAALEGNDAADHLAAGHTIDEFVPLDLTDLGPDEAPADEVPVSEITLPIYSVPDLLAMDIPKPQYLVGLPLGLARGTVGELDAYPKTGKTRFTLDAIWSILHGSTFLDAPTEKAKALYLTEEWLTTWRQALEDSHLLGEEDDGFTWMSLLAAQDRGLTDWSKTCEALRRYCVTNDIGVLPVDTLARWAGVLDENDATQMAAAIMPLRKIAAEGIAVLFQRHDRKGGGVLGESGRGSSAATGEVDYVLHLQKKAGSGETTLRQRELEGVSRLSGETGKLIVELNESGHFDLVGSKGDVMLQRAKDYVRDVLPMDKGEAWTVKELCERFKGSDATVSRAVNELCRDGQITGERKAGHAAQSRASNTVGYWRLSAAQQGVWDLDDE